MAVISVIVRCKHCLRREEYANTEYRNVQADVYGDGWREWDRKTGLAVCRLCAQREREQPSTTEN